MSVACAQNLAKFANQEDGMPNSALIKVYTRCISPSLSLSDLLFDHIYNLWPT